MREDGYAVLKKIRQHPALRQTKVVAVTSRATPEELGKAQAAGFDGFIGKPIHRDHFAGRLKRVIDGEAVWALE